jgi:hypothetical protein
MICDRGIGVRYQFALQKIAKPTMGQSAVFDHCRHVGFVPNIDRTSNIGSATCHKLP